MIDIHCHILPGLDDGPTTIGESLDMCRIAAGDGVDTIVATPHFRPGSLEHASGLIQQRVLEMREALDAAEIAVRILPGADVTVPPELELHVSSHPHLTINGTGCYFLAELPHAAVPPNWERFLVAFLERGMVPIITHPERNGWFLSRPEALVSYVRSGGLVQITAMSLTGEGGEESGRYARHLVQSGLAQVIASDGHASTGRRPVLSEAFRVAAELVGADRARAMVVDVPRAIIEGRRIAPEGTFFHSPKKRSWFRRITRI